MELGQAARIERARNLLLEAMLDANRWDVALDAVANACGARSGQLIAINGDGEVSGHWLTDVPEGFVSEIEAFGLANPVINPRVRIGARAPLMTPIADQDVVDSDARKRSPIYAEMFEPFDLPFNCQVVLLREPGALVRASITRSRKQGALDEVAHSAFRGLMPHLQAAVRVQANLLAARCAATLETLTAIGAAALLLSETGRVIGISPAAESMAAEAHAFQVTNAGIRLSSHADQALFDVTLAGVLAAQREGGCVAPPPVPLSRAALLLDVQPLPRDRMCFGGAPAVIVVIRQAKAEEQGDVLRRAFGLTRVEAEVALAIVGGEAPDTIAGDRGVTIATVRTQLKSIYAKMDVHRQAELVAAIRRLGAGE